MEHVSNKVYLKGMAWKVLIEKQLSLKLIFWQSKELLNIIKHLYELYSLLEYHHCIYFHEDDILFFKCEKFNQ